MICIIYSKSINISYNIWSYIKDKQHEYSNISEYSLANLISNFDEELRITRGFGILVEISSKFYIITCFHIIGQVNMEIFAIASNNNNIFTTIPLKITKIIQELDIVVLEFSNKSQENEFTYFQKNDFDMKIDDIIKYKQNIKLEYYTINDLIIENDFIKNTIPINDIVIENDFLKSIIIPKIPLLKYTCNLENLNGLSGSILRIDNNIIGMTTSYNNMKLEAIPMILLYNLVNASLNYDGNILSVFHFCSKVVDIEENNNNVTCHYIVDCKNTSYQINMMKKNFKFKINDIIYKLNNKNFTEIGTIYDDLLGCELTIDTYMMIMTFCNITIKIDLYRKINEEHTLISYNLYGKSFDNIYNVNIFNNHKYLYWKGFIFTELSEELILNLNHSGIILTGDIFENYKRIHDNKTKIVILIDIDYKVLNKKTLNQLINIKLPYIKYNNGYTLFILEKIGNNKILSLIDLKTILETNYEKKKTMCHYSWGNNDFIKLLI